MNLKLAEILYKAWTTASRLKKWEVADHVEKAIRVNQGKTKELG